MHQPRKGIWTGTKSTCIVKSTHNECLISDDERGMGEGMVRG